MLGRRVVTTLALVVVCLVCFTGAALAVQSPAADGQPAPAVSPRLIVEFQAPPLAAVYKTQMHAASADGKLDMSSAEAKAYVTELQAQQAAFASQMKSVLPNAEVSQVASGFVNGQPVGMRNLTYQVVLNGMAVTPNNGDLNAARAALAKLPNVKAVHFDQAHSTDLYTSTTLINAPVAWNELGGRANAGAGVKFASMDGGVHHLSPMFNGAGYSYPPGFQPNGIGLTDNNNGKIIASRAYFRPWDPPVPDNAFAWPGPGGTPHGVHTASTAAGDIVTDVVYSGLQIGTISGVAPRAYVMSYKVFYNSVTGDASFYDAEGIAALEDIAMDGADVLNNSWGGGPYSIGGPGDPLDTALINTANSGVFVSMSAGNAGPSNYSLDHPSPEYVTVAATTSGGSLSNGTVTITESVSLQGMPFASAEWAKLTPAATYVYDYLPATAVDGGSNVQGCNPFPANSFKDKAALIQRGTCNFSLKAYNAQVAGALFTVVYNNVPGNAISVMACGVNCDQLTTNAIMVGKENGEAMVQFYNDSPAKARISVAVVPFQMGERADLVTNFSSRGPGPGNVLKPDIAAPGNNILAQGYTPGAEGEDVYFGYGQASGTSMASPHVAGAAVLVRQAHPSWPNWAVKSALMSTSKYLDIYNYNLSPAQPLDMGAGRLDLTSLLDPGVVLNPASISFGKQYTATAAQNIVVEVTSVATATETYALSTLYTGDGFTQTQPLLSFAVSPAALTLAPGETKQVTVTFDSAKAEGYGDHQGYIIMDGPVHDAHMPVWARLSPSLPQADVLILDADGSGIGFPDYLGVYTSTLQALGKSYAVADVFDGVPDPSILAAYPVVLFFTGEDYYPVVSTQEAYWLLQYMVNGGTMLAMGQFVTWMLPADVLSQGLGVVPLQDSVSNFDVPTSYATTAPAAPPAFQGYVLSLLQTYMAEVRGYNLDYGHGGVPLFNYNGPFNVAQGTVAVAHRNTPTLELPELAYLGRSLYTSFGLEGMEVKEWAPGQLTVGPLQLLGTALTWASLEAGTGTISNTTPVSGTAMTLFQVNYVPVPLPSKTPSAGIPAYAYQWDFGDGSAYETTLVPEAGHTYACATNGGSNTYTVRTRVIDIVGNAAIISQQFDVSDSCYSAPFRYSNNIWLPSIRK